MLWTKYQIYKLFHSQNAFCGLDFSTQNGMTVHYDKQHAIGFCLSVYKMHQSVQDFIMKYSISCYKIREVTPDASC